MLQLKIMSFKFIFRIDFDDLGQRQPFIDNWRKGSEILQEYPGALGTRLHQIEGTDSLLAIAEWESQEARQAMTLDTKEGKSDRAKRWQAIPKNDSFGKVTVIANATEIGYVAPK